MEAGEQGEGVHTDPFPFFSKCTGPVPGGSKPSFKRSRWSLEAIFGKEAIANRS